MTTEIIHGAPGSYKTSSLVSLYLLDALKDNRTIITNIRGFKTHVDDFNDIYDLESESEIIVVPHDKDGFEQMARFFHWAPKDAFFLMDEGQQIYPSRLTKLNEFDLTHHDDPEWPLTVEAAFDKHRHFGWDIYISTTNIAKIHKEVRQISEFAYRHKNMAGILPMMKGRYKRVQHDPENNGKSLSHAISSKICKIDKRAFNAYQSTTTDQASDIKSSNALLGSSKIIFYGFIFLVAIGLFAYNITGLSPDQTDQNLVSQPSTPVPDLVDEKGILEASNIPKRDVFHRSTYQDNILAFIQSIQFYSARITTVKADNSVLNTYHFHSPIYGRIDSNQLKFFGVTYFEMTSIIVLEYNDHHFFIRSYDPNPERYHPDNQNQQPQPILPTVALNSGDGALAEEIAF